MTQSIPTIPPLYADNGFVVILLVCFFIIAAVLSDKGGYVMSIYKSYFLPHQVTEDSVATTLIQYMKLGLYVNAFLSAAICLAAYVAKAGHGGITSLPTFGILLGIVIAAYFTKKGLYKAMNWVFSNKTETAAWKLAYTQWSLLSGLLLYPIALATICMDFCSRTIAILLIIYLAITEICLLFKAFHIFLTKKYGSLQLFAYLCALELVPLLIAGKALVLFT